MHGLHWNNLTKICLCIPTHVYRQQAGGIPVVLFCSDEATLLLRLLTWLGWLLPDGGAAALDKPLKGLASPFKEMMLFPAVFAMFILTLLSRPGGRVEMSPLVARVDPHALQVTYLFQRQVCRALQWALAGSPCLAHLRRMCSEQALHNKVRRWVLCTLYTRGTGIVWVTYVKTGDRDRYVGLCSGC